ncbi:fatty acid--CoA ligase [Solimonas sp. K1W22B-7]|uniref:AMP-binding protein n=1 Tax=Solimonas sp. K1W22B-7 TaxID=2303331 RepID=UPI000E3324A5|nr:AMP-binding protein [Solimonas sp. K1W22B-7]AXQ30527.1 fatty acid--CoA ligase [Solimonas sp. K1W22B-7]
MVVPFRAFSAFDHHVQHAPSRALVDSELGSMGYAEAAERVRRLINGFRALGLGETDRVAVVSRNRTEVLLLILAALKGGPVIVPVNHRLAPSEMGWILEDSDCCAVIAEAEFASALVGRIPVRVAPAARLLLGPAEEGWGSFESWLQAQGDEDRPPPADIGRAYLQVYTSGTTGRPKGVVLTEHNCLGQQFGLMAAVDLMPRPGESVYQALPLFHVGGIFASLWSVYRGASLLLRREFSPAVTEDLMACGNVAHAVLVPAMIRACLSACGGRRRDFDGLRSIIYGASPVTEDTLRAAAQRYGCDFVQIYGMTETHSVISVLDAEDHRRALDGERAQLLGSAGRPVAGAVLRIVDGDGMELGRGQVGEICVRAPQVMAGYWKRADATQEALREGFLFTGDAGYLDGSGYLHIVDRLKDIIVSGGENVASTEVEEVLLCFPQVADAAVIGVPDERWGEAVKAIVVCAGEELDEEQLMEHCRRHLGGFKVPRSISRVDAIPRNGAGKILKARLREPYWAGVSRRVS